MVDWFLAMEEVRKQCGNSVVHGLIEELDRRVHCEKSLLPLVALYTHNLNVAKR
jgi:hypothetical protein